jgi:hypothetical protein
MFTLTLQISKLTKAVVLNSFPHGRFWQFVNKENVRCTRLMQRSLQVAIRQMFVLCSLKIEAQCRSPFILLWGNLIQTEPSIGASHQSSQTWSPQIILVSNWPISKKSSLLKLLSQMNRNLVGSNYGRSSIKIAHFIPIRWQTWSPQTILVSDWPIG